jgi:hypothetical protein
MRRFWRSSRNETLTDSLLAAAPWMPPGIRVWAARRAAARGLGAPALRATPDDPVVLARLGMYSAAARARGRGRSARGAIAAAAAALGDPSAAREFLLTARRLSVSDRRFLAASVAPFDARLASDILPKEDRAKRAACALAAGDVDAAERELKDVSGEAHTGYLKGAILAWRGHWQSARQALNDAFCADGLAPPLSIDSALPTTLDAFSCAASLPSIDGPLVSIIVPAHNATSSLQIAVASLIAQTWRNIELIIVDDRSTDGTAALAASLATEQPRIRVLSNVRAPGAYGARNTGISAARGAFVALHDADDWAHPQRIERQMHRLADDKAVAVCRYFRLDANGRPVCPRVFPFVRLSPIAITTRRETWSAVGLFEEVGVGADSEWLARTDERFGRRANPRMSEVGMVALWEKRSLSAAPATGLLGEGLQKRTAYVEAWRRRHAFGRTA